MKVTVIARTSPAKDRPAPVQLQEIASASRMMRIEK
jgi:hypothetical protein